MRLKMAVLMDNIKSRLSDHHEISNLVYNIITEKWEDHFSAVAVGPLLEADSSTGGKIWLAIGFRNGGYWSVYRVWGSKKNIMQGKGIMTKLEQDAPNEKAMWDALYNLTSQKMDTNSNYAMFTGNFYYDQSDPVKSPAPEPEPESEPTDRESILKKSGYSIF